MFNTPLDINYFFKNGYFITNIDQIYANKLLSIIKNEVWVKVTPDIEEYSGTIEKDYKNRYISVGSMLRPMDLNSAYKHYRDSFNKWASPIISKYKTADRVLLSALMGVEGYFMDMHSDVGDRCPFTVLLYLGDEINEMEDVGGNLNIFNVQAEDPHNHPELIERIAPLHGRLVILNNLDPTIYHSVDPLMKNAKRYSLLSSFGIDFLPDWSYDYEVDRNMSGQVLNPVAPVSIDGHNDVLNMLK